MSVDEVPKSFLNDAGILEAYSDDAAGNCMKPTYVVRPGGEEEICDCLAFCNDRKLPVTPSGSRTSYTAAAITDDGVLLSTQKMKRIIDIREDAAEVIVEPGILLGELKTRLREQNLFYPPDPTSEQDATVGGTVATNASGARTYKYGPTAFWVSGLRVVVPGGEVLDAASSDMLKTSTGPRAIQSPALAWVGSEGTLGVVTQIRLKVIRGVPESYGLLAFFPSAEKLLNLVLSLDFTSQSLTTPPRAVELFDGACLDVLRDAKQFSQLPDGAAVALYLEVEYNDETMEKGMEEWLELLEENGALVDDIVFADSESKVAELRALRHYIPATLNELGVAAKPLGGGKVSTDWAVPLRVLPKMLVRASELCDEYGFSSNRVYRYGHIGNGHPHFNVIAKDSVEKQRALLLREALCKEAVASGGTVAAEHGIGKLRRGLAALERSAAQERLFKALKCEFDPNAIMAPGNLF
jgi:FAD/FMN-containing dehydrogenase